MSLPVVRLRPGREIAPRQRHPWVMSGSVASVEGDVPAGAAVRVVSHSGESLGIGDYDPHTQIRVRLMFFGRATELPPQWLEGRLRRAVDLRAALPPLAGTSAVRLINAEGDGLPGLTVDRFAEWLVVKVATPAMQGRLEALSTWLWQHTQASGAWLRGEGGGSDPVSRTLFGTIPEELVQIEERERRYWVDLCRGQKTGFYLDQRDSRDLFQALAPGTRALDLFAYTGGFATAAACGGAREIVAVESSPAACALLTRNAPNAEVVAGDVAEFLREDERTFDLISIDPPPFAKRKHDVAAACRAYHELHVRAFARAAHGANVLTFTCSHHVDAGQFRATVAAAARAASRRVQLLRTLAAPVDHPVDLAHPQGEYLKGLLLRVDHGE